uniref:Coronin n=1 Tax=Blastobotrys adeninivorans TaxID=409370 RepID=A0A060TAF2_BLAAD
MSGRFVRASKFRHVYGQPVKRELYYDNIRLTHNAWDSNLIKVNPKYLSVNWDASGGGAFAVIPLSEAGKLQDTIPLFRGHTSNVLDTDWNPFDDDVIASASDDGTIGIYRVPDNFTTRHEDPEDIEDVMPVKRLKGHSRKVGHVLFHPTAENVLASSSGDYTVKIWDIEKEECLATLEHKDLITSMAFNYNGSLLATVSRDKTIRIWDIRKQEVLSQGKGHAGAKSQRLAWLGSSDRIVTTGFDASDRQFAVWDVNDIAKGPLGGFRHVGFSAGICMPFFDEGTNILYLAGKGDGNIQYYEFADDEMHELSEYQSTDPQRGVAVLPRRGLRVNDHEIFRVYKTVNDNCIAPIPFYIPRKSDTFQEDVYPAARAGEPALTAQEWWSGKDSSPKVISLAAVFNNQQTEAFVEQPKVNGNKTKDTKETKTETKSETKPTEPEQKTEPKSEPKEVKEESKVHTPNSKPSTMFASSSVDNFLEKALNSDDPDLSKNKLDDSGWNSDDDKPAPPRDIEDKSKPEPKQPEPKQPAPKEPGAKQPEPKVKEPEVKAEKVNSVNSKSPDLTEQVATLTSAVESLTKRLEARDAAFDALSEKLDKVLAAVSK